MQNLLDEMQEIVLGENALRHIISINVNGEPVTARELISQIQPQRSEASLGSEALQPPNAASIKEVGSLQDSEIDRIVDAYLNSIPTGRALAIEGYGSFTPSQLKEEVRNKTAVGEEIKNTVLQYNRFIEEAIKKGVVRTEAEAVAAP
jgi:hypothetical protein